MSNPARISFPTDVETADRFKARAQARSLTQGDYLKRLVQLHDKAKVMADTGNPTLKDLLLELQLQTVTVVG